MKLWGITKLDRTENLMGELGMGKLFNREYENAMDCYKDVRKYTKKRYFLWLNMGNETMVVQDANVFEKQLQNEA